jgi:hypothetical protein
MEVYRDISLQSEKRTVREPSIIYNDDKTEKGIITNV